MSTIQNKAAWQKTSIEITGINFTSERVIEVTIKDTGKTAFVNRDLAEFFPGRMFVPLWLAKRINPRGRFS